MESLIPILGFASVGVSLISQAMRANAQREADNTNLGEMYRSAALEDAAAADALRRGVMLAGIKRLQGRQVASRQRVAFSQGGVATDTGTPAAMSAYSDSLSELDALQLQNNAAREAWQHTETGRKYRTQMKQLRSEMDNRALGEFLGGASSILSTGASLLGGR